ncbi:ubiquitin-specific protease ubp2 [Coemansia aciculifera]|uniref:Ubiquitin-specific protease ubp2 n=1 Tax=Coemansia aciculifera TaxID=417176 RepID=A0ACC1M5H4_9FUNG|nr:ubiquitin-specific protease ubp2 [Coemansia aciculifera]
MAVVDDDSLGFGVVGVYFVKTQLSEWVPAEVARELGTQHRHRHVWVRVPTENSIVSAGDGWQGTCRDCLCQLQLTASNTATNEREHNCIDTIGHHFHNTFVHSYSRSARCCKCGVVVAANLTSPVLRPAVVRELEQARQAPHAHHPVQGARSLRDTLTTLRRLARNAWEKDRRPIKSDSPKPRQLLQFDAACVRILCDAMGFQLRNSTEYYPPEIESAGYQQLPRVRDDLAVLISRVHRRLPEPERSEAPAFELVGEALARWLGAQDYERRNGGAGAVGDACRHLGVPDDAADSLVAWAYRRLVEEDAETGGARAQQRYDGLSTICAARDAASAELLTLVDDERDRGLVATSAVRAACLALFGDAQVDPASLDPETLRHVFMARLGSTFKPAARMELAAHLAILACAMRSQALEDYAAEIKASIAALRLDTWAQLPVGLANIGNTCYLNCMLQCLFSIAPIRRAVMRFGDRQTWNEDCLVGRRRDATSSLLSEDEIRRALRLVALLRNLFESLVTCRTEAWEATGGGEHLQAAGHPLASPPPSTAGYPVVTPARELADMLLQTPSASDTAMLQQQDVDECMAQCVSLLDHALPPSTGNSSWIEELLSGHLVLSTDGKESQPSTETFVNLSLNLPPDRPSADINECLDAFFEPSEMPNTMGVFRRQSIKDAPPVLCIQIQRVQFDMVKMKPFKINTHLRLRNQISLARFTQQETPAPSDLRLRELRQKLLTIDQRLQTLAIPTTPDGGSGGGDNALVALDRVQKFISGIGQWAQLEAAQQLLADLAPEHVSTLHHCAQMLGPQLESLSSGLNDSKRQWDAERLETASEIDGIYESVSQEDTMAYTLHAVFIHSGLTPEFGHYWVYIRDCDRGSAGEMNRRVRWLKFDDSTVTVVKEEEVFRKVGEDPVANPYYLLYARSLDYDTTVDLGV